MPNVAKFSTDVSRETRRDLERFVELVAKWNGTIALVSKHDVGHLWNRHVIDSVATVSVAPPASIWLDLGSGAGFPGIVTAIVRRDTDVTLVESDRRKAAFLRTAGRELGLAITVIAARIEDVDTIDADVISARALAPLRPLLGYCHRHGRIDTIYVLPKGPRWRDEVADAEKAWRFDMDVIEMPDGRHVVLRVTSLEARFS